MVESGERPNKKPHGIAELARAAVAATMLSAAGPVEIVHAKGDAAFEQSDKMLQNGKGLELRMSESAQKESQKLTAFIHDFFEEKSPQRDVFSLIANSLPDADLKVFLAAVVKVAHRRIFAGGSGVGFITSTVEFQSAVYSEMSRNADHELSISQIASMTGPLSRGADHWIHNQEHQPK